MADKNIGKITQIVGAVLDIKFADGHLPEINEAINITTKKSGILVVEVSQHLGDDTVRCIAMGPTECTRTKACLCCRQEKRNIPAHAAWPPRARLSLFCRWCR